MIFNIAKITFEHQLDKVKYVVSKYTQLISDVLHSAKNKIQSR